MTIVAGVRDRVISDLAPGGVLRAAINLGNPVLAQGPAAAPAGVTVDIARELGARFGIAVDLVCFAAARESFEAMVRGDADICFLAIEPARAAEVAFTAPYVVIEGVFVVREDSGITTLADVDHEQVRIGVNEGSAYDLFLSRTLERASVVRGQDGIGMFRRQGLTPAPASGSRRPEPRPWRKARSAAIPSATHGRDRRQPGELGEHVMSDGVRATAVGVNGENRDIFVDRQAPLVYGIEIGPAQQRPEPVALDSRHGLVVAHAQIDDPRVTQHRAGSPILDGTAAERDDRFRAPDEIGDGGVLKLTEVSLALGGKDVPDLAAEALLDQHITVYEGLTEALRDDAPDRGLPSAHETDEYRHHWPSCFPRLPGRAAIISGMLSLLRIVADASSSSQ